MITWSQQTIDESIDNKDELFDTSLENIKQGSIENQL